MRRSSPTSCRSRAIKPVLEGLEGRFLLYATTGDHFTYGSRITWSIEPDGTNLGGTYSNLVSTLDNKFGAGNWQRAIQDAFAVWENVANINTVQVSDNGGSLDSGSYQQGSPYFGDIRIGGFALDPNVLGFTLLPPPANGGSMSGDIVLNTNLAWQIGSNYDLESVMIHEIGHALGMGHSADSTASMYSYYHGVQQYVNSDDVAGVDSIWSPRQEDGFVVGNQNFYASQAVNVTQFMGPTNQILLGPLNVAKASESYWFKATTPANASNIFQAVVQSQYLSELSPKVTVYDSSLHTLAQVASPANTYGSIISGAIYYATPNTTYYVKVTSSNAGSTGTGAYALLINMGSQNLNAFPPPNTQVASQPSQGGGATQEQIGGSSADVAASDATVNAAATPGPVSRLANVASNPGALNALNGLVKSDSGLKSLTPSFLDAWENIHSFSGATQSGGGSQNDLPEQLMIGGKAYLGDFYLVHPSSTPTPTTPAVAPKLTDGALIPLDPTGALSTEATSAPRKNGAATIVNGFHPRGPL